MEPKIGIKAKNLAEVAHHLNQLLADEFILYTKTRRAHWNIEGEDFYDKHKFFEAQYEELDEVMDEVAERIRSLGHYAPSTLKEFLKLTRLTEVSREENTSKGFIKDLLLNHESVIVSLRENITRFSNDFQDLGSSDFVTGLLTQHEKMAWMLRSHLR